MWFAVLGPLLVHDGNAFVDVPKGRQRALLAALLLQTGKTGFGRRARRGGVGPGAPAGRRGHAALPRRG